MKVSNFLPESFEQLKMAAAGLSQKNTQSFQDVKLAEASNCFSIFFFQKKGRVRTSEPCPF